MEGKPKTHIYYDGRCPMCTALMGAIEGSRRGAEFELHDMHASAMPFPKEAVGREIHVVGADGRVRKGADGIMEIVGRYPRWRLLAAAGRMPLIRTLLRAGYRVVARNRRFLFGTSVR